MNNRAIKTDLLLKLLLKLWFFIEPKRRIQLFFLALLMLISSFAEIFSIGAALPFLSVLIAPKYIFDNQFAKLFFDLAGVSSQDDLLLPITLIFILLVIVSSIIRLTLLWVSTKLSFSIGADISKKVFNNALYQTYETHLSINSSETIDAVITKSNNVIYGVLVPSVNLLNSALLISVILIFLFFINPVITIISFLGFGSIYLVIVKFAKKQVLKDGEKIASESSHLIKILQEGLGGIRDIIMTNSQAVYINTYHKTNNILRYAQAKNLFVTQSPRFGIEALGVVLIALIAFWLNTNSRTMQSAIPFLGAFALAAQRLLPLLQQSFYNWTNIRGMQPTLREVIDILERPLSLTDKIIQQKKITFHKSICFKKTSFHYLSSKDLIFKNLDLEIIKGSCVGFIGETGAGKSTLVDLFMGSILPTSGHIEIDNIELTKKIIPVWQKHISHVPQSIFLTDHSIAENIAFGVESKDINFEKIKQVARAAQLADFIESLPNKYDTQVGERGVKLSGGQRQRIGIARALYRNADVIILDEATSALDNRTEDNVMNSIFSLTNKVTTLIIAHRITTLKNCDVIYEISNKGIKKVSSYEDLIK